MARRACLLLSLSALLMPVMAAAEAPAVGDEDASPTLVLATAGDLAAVTGTAAVLAVTNTAGTGALAVELPPVDPGPDIGPVIEGPARTPDPEVPRQARTAAVIRTILGLVALAALAYMAGHPRVQQWEERLGIAQLITAGFPFVLLGFLARSVNVLSDSVLAEISPLLRLGLGWIGFVIGFRFDVRNLVGLSPRTARLVVLLTGLPFVAVLGSTGLLMAATTGLTRETLEDPVFVRDALILGTAAAMTAMTAARLVRGPPGESLVRVLRLEQLAGIVGLAVVAAYFRPAGAEIGWQLPGLAWLFLTLGLGVALGLLVYGVLERASGIAEFAALTLGAVALVSGVAGYLHLSSVVVAFIAGVTLANVAPGYTERFADALERLQRPIYLLSLVVIGALWNVSDWRGWALVPLFTGARLAGKWAAVRVAGDDPALGLRDEERDALRFAPIGSLAIAIVVNAQLLYPGGSISRIVSAVIGGAIVTEVIVQWLGRRPAAAAGAGTGTDGVVPGERHA